jgi:hypothetical protein
VRLPRIREDADWIVVIAMVITGACFRALTAGAT